jgi:hypothetical protein
VYPSTTIILKNAGRIPPPFQTLSIFYKIKMAKKN